MTVETLLATKLKLSLSYFVVSLYHAVRSRGTHHAKVIATDGCAIVWLRGVSYPKVVGKGDSLSGQPGKIGVCNGFGIVGVLEPDGDESIKSSAWYMRGWALSLSRSRGGVYRSSAGGSVLGKSGTRKGKR